MDFQGDFGQGPESSEESYRERLYREHLHCREWKDARTRNVDDASGESSEVRDMSLDIGGKMTPCYKVVEKLAEWHSAFGRKVERKSHELEYLGEKISKVWKKWPDSSLLHIVKCKGTKLKRELLREEVLGLLEAGRGKREFSPRGFRGNVVLLTPWFWTRSLYTWETIHIHGFKLPACGYYITVAPGTEYSQPVYSSIQNLNWNTFSNCICIVG